MGLIKKTAYLFLVLTVAVNAVTPVMGTSAHASDYDDVCGGGADGKDVIDHDGCKYHSANEIIQSRATTCGELCVNDDTQIATKVMLGVWSGVFAVCAASCIWPALQGACTGASIAGVGGDVISAITIGAKDGGDVMGSLTSSAGMAISLITSVQSSASKSGSQGASKSSSCWGALAMSALAVGIKGYSLSQLTSQHDDLMKQAAQYKTQEAVELADEKKQQEDDSRKTSQGATLSSDDSNSGPGGGGPNGGKKSGPFRPGQPVPGADPRREKICGSSDPNEVISCAVESDPRLPPFVKSDKFKSDLQKLGLDPVELAKNPPSPSQLGAMLANIVGQADAADGFGSQLQAIDDAVAKDLSKTGAHFADTTGGSVYSGGAGAGGGANAGPALPDFGGMMAGLMGSLNPKKADEAGIGTNEIDFMLQKQGRSPASLAEDPKVSIFDRVTYRYHHDISNLGGIEWTLPANRMALGLPPLIKKFTTAPQ